MITLSVKDTKKRFFQVEKQEARVTKKSEELLLKFGAYVRRTAKGLIRTAKKPSKPGKPPKSHVGLLKDLIFFWKHNWHGWRRSVRIGPAKLNGRKFRESGGAPIPQILELGGQIVVSTRKQKRYWLTLSKRKQKLRPKRFHPINTRIAPRPFMRPALLKERPKFVRSFKNCLQSIRK